MLKLHIVGIDLTNDPVVRIYQKKRSFVLFICCPKVGALKTYVDQRNYMPMFHEFQSEAFGRKVGAPQPGGMYPAELGAAAFSHKSATPVSADTLR
jgi:hypothetical protein